MAVQKQKAELIAIYRLEFYKKQKNWKLSVDARKEKEHQNSSPNVPVRKSKILNETYSVDTHVHKDVSVLNDAFLKDESDKDAPVSPVTPAKLQAQWLHPIHACQECQSTSVKPQNPWADYLDDGNGLDVLDRCSGDGNDFEGFNGCVDGMVWTNSGISQPAWTGDSDCPKRLPWPADDVLRGQQQPPGQPTPWPDDQVWAPQAWREEELLVESLESVDEFMIGAHSAPHSSEVELGVHAEGGGGGGGRGELDASAGSLSRMSGAALSAAVRRHTGSLRRLLREARQRKYRSTLSLDVCAPDHFGLAPRDFFSTDYSYEAFPTRDIPSTPMSPIHLCADAITPLPPTKQPRDTSAPLSPTTQYTLAPQPPHRYNQIQYARCTDECTPPSPANLYRDGFLAGSYRNKVPLGFIGRGRGRLPEDRGVEV